MAGYPQLASRFSLPGGLLLNEEATEGRPCAEALLRQLTGQEEEWLARNRGTPNAVAVSELLDRCVLSLDDGAPPRRFARHMLAGDRDYLMLQLRRLMLGDGVQAVLECGACGSKMDIDFNAAEIPVERRPQRKVWHTLEFSGRTIMFRLPAGADQECIAESDVASAVEVLLDRCVANEAGQPLTPEEKQAVIEAMDKTAPQVVVELELKCPECGDAFTTPFDVTSFFFEEMRVDTAQLFREVHSLAFYYHWSEGDILSMARGRRRMYLSLLSDALREE